MESAWNLDGKKSPVMNIPRFGTDGVRGVANAELTPEVVTALGRAAARVLGAHAVGTARVTFLVGADTRQSGPLMLAALSAGLMAEGCDVIDLGVLPTPAVALASAQRGLPAAMISASHNPFQDNGIKFFQVGGRKLDDAIESQIDAIYIGLLDGSGGSRSASVGAAVGTLVTDDGAAAAAFAEAMRASLQGRRLDGLKVVLDTANGALSAMAGPIVSSLGASVVVLHDSPNGVNINEGCGSTHLQSLQAAVVQHGAHLGLGFDGDADRCLAVDAHGVIVDGDQIMAMLAVDLHSSGRLVDDTVVVTVMTNLGFKLAMAERGVNVVETKVGDRYVLEALEAGSFTLGGEQSGHVIFTDVASTGDGLLTGLLVMDLMSRSGRSLADLGSIMERLPQVLRNVKGVDRSKLDGAAGLWSEVAAVETELAGRGRVLIRPSGTEALVRVMVEAPTAELAESATARLCAVVERELA
jgi:phosphoglucosamine mutase